MKNNHYSDSLLLQKCVEATGVSLNSISCTDPDIENYLSGLCTSPEKVNGIEHIIKRTRAGTFDDIVHCAGMALSTGAWIENGENLICEGKTLADLICTREDLYENLLAHGIEADLAWDLTEHIRKGQASNPEKQGWADIMRQYGIPEYYIDCARHILYLPPRSLAEQHALLYWQFLYFRVHFPEVFDRISDTV